MVLGKEGIAVGADAPFVCPGDCGRERAFVACRITDHLRHLDSGASGKTVVDFVQTADIGSELLDLVGILEFRVNDRTVIGAEFKASTLSDDELISLFE